MDHFWFSLRNQSARPEMVHPDTQQPRHHKGKTSQPQCQRMDSQLMVSLLIPPPFTLPVSPALPLLRSTNKMEVLVNAGIKFSPRSLPHHLPAPLPSTFCNINLADIEADKKRKLYSAQVDETDKASLVTKSFPHQ